MKIVKSLLIIAITTFILIFSPNVKAESNGFITKGQYTYYYENGIKVTGFKQIDGKIYFFSRDKTKEGAMLTGKIQIGNYYYCFNESGILQIGLFEYNGDKYYANENGELQFGYQIIDGKTYFFSRDMTRYGTLKTGKFEIDGQYKVFNEDLQTGLFEYNGDKYYANDKGILLTGFQKINGQKYFFSRDKTKYGVMRYGWIECDGYRYYLDTDGSVVTGYKKIDGRDYLFDNEGKMNTGFVTIDGKTYYYFADGSFAKDWLTIGNTKYFFNSLGIMIGKNVKKIIDVSEHQGVIDWNSVIKYGNIDGVILRIAAGCEKEDAQLAKNIAELKRLGIPYGIYIYSYAENYNEGILYANFTIEMIEKYNLNPTLGIYLDLESNNITSYMGVAEYEQVVKGYMEVMNHNGYGNITKIYTYTNYANTALNSEYLRNLITWIAQYNHYCTYTGKYDGWQYSSTDSISGIKGSVDVSVWFN